MRRAVTNDSVILRIFQKSEELYSQRLIWGFSGKRMNFQDCHKLV